MTTRNTPPAGPGNQRSADIMADCRFLVLRIRSALLEVSGAFRGRGHARFGEIARDDWESRHRWLGNVTEMCRAQMHEACERGPDEKAETIRRVQRMCRELEFTILTGFLEDPGTTPSLPALSLDYTQQTAEAIVAVQRFSLTRSESDAETARREALDVVNASSRMLELVGRAMRPLRQVR